MEDTFKCYNAHDPAIDAARSRFDKFLLTRDPSHLVWVEGIKPTAYHLRRVPERLVRNYIRIADGDETSTFTRAFRASVVKVENVTLTTGEHFDHWEPGWTKYPNINTECLSEDEIDLFHTINAIDIGSVAYQRCFLVPGRARLYAVPHLSRLALDQRVVSSLPVDEILEMLDQSNDVSRGRLAELLCELGGLVTGATAKENPEPAPKETAPSEVS